VAVSNFAARDLARPAAGNGSGSSRRFTARGTAQSICPQLKRDRGRSTRSITQRRNRRWSQKSRRRSSKRNINKVNQPLEVSDVSEQDPTGVLPPSFRTNESTDPAQADVDSLRQPPEFALTPAPASAAKPTGEKKTRLEAKRRQALQDLLRLGKPAADGGDRQIFGCARRRNAPSALFRWRGPLPAP